MVTVRKNTLVRISEEDIIDGVVIIPDDITHIGECALSGYDSLKKVVMPNSVVYIGVRAFSNCINLEEIKLSNSLTIIKGLAFSDCTSLKEITIPKKTDIGYRVFDNCPCEIKYIEYII